MRDDYSNYCFSTTSTTHLVSETLSARSSKPMTRFDFIKMMIFLIVDNVVAEIRPDITLDSENLVK